MNISKTVSFGVAGTGTIEISSDLDEVTLAVFSGSFGSYSEPAVFGFTVDDTFELVDALHDAIEEATRGDATEV